MSEARAPLRRVVVVGAGQVGIITAIALKHALRSSEVLIAGEVPGPTSFSDWSSTSMPFTNHFHERLGIAESAIMQHAGGSHRLLTRYTGWDGPDDTGVFCYGDSLSPEAKAMFQCGASFGRTSYLAERLVGARRFARTAPDRKTPLSQITHALRWDPAAYRNLLAAKARQLGIASVLGPVTSVDWSQTGSIEAIHVAGKDRIEADLYVDCSGPRAALLACHPDFAVVDWADALPTRKLYSAQINNPAVDLEDRISLFQSGWHSRVAGRRAVCISVGVGKSANEEEVIAALGGKPELQLDLAPGRVKRPWLGNVIAVGDASARFEPLGPWNLELAHRQIDLLLKLLPGRQIEPLEREEYNRRSTLMMEAVRDILSIHFSSSRAHTIFDGMALPVGAANVIYHFTRRGRIPFQEEFPLSAQEQFSLLSALGHVPGTSPASRPIDETRKTKIKRQLDTLAAEALAFAPPYEEWLAWVTRQIPIPGQEHHR
ncbi:tryptophan 7-halogenase [Qipengyuania flava]|nr:tryptophan 7-halogenase [Qipengyuania flava]